MSELRAAAERVSPDGEPGQRWAITAGGLALVVLLSAIDASSSEIFAATVVIGPFLAALSASERQTAGVAVAAVAAALLSGVWNDNAGDAAYFVRAAVVLAGGAFSVLAARRRLRATRAEAIGEQLTAALSNLAEAVVVQAADRSLIYANEAAAVTLGFPSAAALLSTPPSHLIDTRITSPRTARRSGRSGSRRRSCSRARSPGRSRSASSTARRARSAGA